MRYFIMIEEYPNTTKHNIAFANNWEQARILVRLANEQLVKINSQARYKIFDNKTNTLYNT